MMEIIDISSSSPVAALPAPPTYKTPSTRAFIPSNIDFDFGDNFFDDTGSINFSTERLSTKRRKVTSAITARVSTITTSPVSDQAVVHNLSSDPAEYDVPKLRQMRSAPDHVPLPANEVVEEQDEGMFFSSSAPPAQIGSEGVSKRVRGVDSVARDDPIETSSQPHATSTTRWSTATAKLLADLEASKTSVPIKRGLSWRSNTHAVSQGTSKIKIAKKIVAIDDNIIDSSQPAQNSQAEELDEVISAASPKKKRVKKSDAEKEAEKEAKRLEKESKAAAKQLEKDIVEVNKVKTNKNVAVREMMLDLPVNIKNKSLGNQVEEFMKEQEVPVSYYSDEVDMTETDEGCSPSRQGSVIRWRRKLTAQYDEDTDEWTPLSRPKITPEKHIIIHLTGDEFAVTITTSPTSRPSTADGSAENTPSLDQLKQNLDMYITLLRSRYPSTTLILIIQGLSAWLKRNASAKNRAYTAAVRAQNAELLESASTTASGSRKKPAVSKSPSVDLSWLSPDHIELLNLHLQLHHSQIQLIHTTSPSTSAHQILLLTQHLATRPYRHAETTRNLRHANFCTTTGQFRTGQGSPLETWLLMLEKLPRLTLSMAQGIVAAGYESPAALLHGFKALEERDGKREAMGLLEDVRKAANKDGAWSERRLGKELSRRLYKVFMGTEAGSMDGIS